MKFTNVAAATALLCAASAYASESSRPNVTQSPANNQAPKTEDQVVSAGKDTNENVEKKTGTWWEHIVANKYIYGAVGVGVVALVGGGIYMATKKSESDL